MLIQESDLILPALRLLAAEQTGFLSTEDLIKMLEQYFRPTGADAAPLQGRHDSHFSQKVRNLVSHRNASTSIETKGWAAYDQNRRGWEITPAGRAFVTDMDKA